jgi:hypothetical protein
MSRQTDLLSARSTPPTPTCDHGAVRHLRKGVRADPRAVERDLPDLVDFMLGTGSSRCSRRGTCVRTGER